MRKQLRLMVTTVGMAASCLTISTFAQSKEIVRFLHNETDPPSIDFFNKAITEFEAQNPDIEVQMEAVDTAGRLQKLMASINTKTVPEVFKILPEERYQFAQKGYIAQLDDLISTIGKDDFIPGALVPIDGHIYDVPYTLGNYGILMYRSDLFSKGGIKVPTTWPEMMDAAQKLSTDSMKGLVFPAGNNRATTVFFSQLMWSAGGTYFDKDLKVTFNSPQTVEALKYLKDISAYAPDGVASYSFGDMINVYLAGKVGMDIYAPRVLANAAANTPEIFANTEAAALPVGASGVGVKFISSNSFAIASEAAGNKNVEASKKFLAFLVTGERLKDFSLTVFPHLIPPLHSVQDGVIQAGKASLSGREDLARMSFDTSNSLDFDTEAGAVFADGKVTRSGVVNPYIGPIIARGIPAQVVQRVIIQGEDPAEAAAWGAEQMQQIVDDLRKS